MLTDDDWQIDFVIDLVNDIFGGVLQGITELCKLRYELSRHRLVVVGSWISTVVLWDPLQLS